ncbi:unnamed protein product [Symbiodinium natans]|uniref:C3H1-type domain-containing protein n=1 Tax=Symbiodinium natans TaxID=878477 RepID=A0A812RDU9_9DINO|nr:unnamed protein product [Symbiodinium natans]
MAATMECGSFSREATPEGLHLTHLFPDGESTTDGCATPSERSSAKGPNMKLVFGLLERGLPSLQRGYRTPDPSPTRTGLPKCAAYKEFMEEDNSEPLPVCAERGRTPAKEKDRSPSPTQQPWFRLQTPSPEPTPLPMPAMPEDFLQQFLRPQPRKDLWADMEDASDAEDDMPAGAKTMQHPLCISIGSEGHPFSCGPACKYASKGKGCKDGANCDHCHLCKWKKPVAAPGSNPSRQNRGRQHARARRSKQQKGNDQ